MCRWIPPIRSIRRKLIKDARPQYGLALEVVLNIEWAFLRRIPSGEHPKSLLQAPFKCLVSSVDSVRESCVVAYVRPACEVIGRDLHVLLHGPETRGVVSGFKVVTSRRPPRLISPPTSGAKNSR